MTQIEKKHWKMYQNLIDFGYFVDEDNNINFTFEDFKLAICDPETVSTLYDNLVDDGYFEIVDGEISVSKEQFAASLSDSNDILEYYPLTDNQFGVYLDWEQHREGLQYNVTYGIKLKGYDADRLKAAIETAIEAHTYLKARLAIVDGKAMLQRRDECKLNVEIIKLQNEPTQEFFQSRVRPFNLFEDDLCRFEIYVIDGAVNNENINVPVPDVYLFHDTHHIITDGISDAVLIRDIFTAYSGQQIKPETYTAFDRALEEQETKESEEYTIAEEYFKNLLSGKETTVYPHSTNAAGADNCKYIRMQLDRKNVDVHSTKLGITVSNYIMTVFLEAIRRLTREKDILITTVNNGREHIDMQDIQGFFVKTLPIVYKTGSDPSSLQQQFMETVNHECFPYTQMVHDFGIHPEIMYVYEGGLLDGVDDSQDIEYFSFDLDTAKVPLSLTVNPEQNVYNMFLEYNEALYSEEDMRMLLQCVVKLAQNYAAANIKDDVLSLTDCPMLAPDEEQRIIALGTGDTLDYDHTKTYVDLFRQQAAKTPDAVAVVDATSQLTYRELDETSTEYAKHVTPGTFVCVEMPRVKESIVAVIGIWKAGSAYVPIDPEYPEERKSMMREECDGQPLPVNNEQLTVNNGQVAYMIYTSGSTGKPKGVMVRHEGLAALVAWNNTQFPQGTGTQHIVHSSFSFDASVLEFACPLCAGGTIHILSSELRVDINKLIDYINDKGITAMAVSMQLGVELVNTHRVHLDYMVLGGEKMPPMQNHDFPVYNQYGPTEFTVASSYYRLKGNDSEDIPIGRPVPNTVNLICDIDGHLLPQGAVGELCLSGKQIALGYWNNPELTKQRFTTYNIQHSTFNVYRTGDLCRWNSENQIEFVGRIDNQVKLRGYRIELGEIEAVALSLSGVRQAVALIKNNLIVLYYTGEEISDAETAMRNSQLASYMIPSVFMHLDTMPITPNGKIDRKALPEPQFDSDEEYVAPRNDKEQIISDAFKTALAIKTDVSIKSRFYSLGGDSIKAIRFTSLIHQHGLQLSVADLMKLQTVEELAKVAVSIEAEEENFDVYIPTVKESFSSIEEYQRVNADFAERGITLQRTYPLTPMQESMLLNQLSNPDSWGYRLVSRFKLNIIPSESQLRTAVDALAIQHETLRTSIIHQAVSKPLQAITDRIIEIQFEDITHSDRTVEDIHHDQLDRGFDLQWDSLMRVVCIVTGDSQCQLLIALHHIITDGWSMPIYLTHFFQDLKSAIENGNVNGNENQNQNVNQNENGDIVPQSAESACHTQENVPDGGMFQQHVLSLQLRDKEASLNYWHELLEGYDTKAEITPSVAAVSEEQQAKANDRLTITIDASQTHKLKNLCAESNATLSNAVELAWGIVLQRYTRQDDVVFAKVVSCRDKAPMDMSHVVGPFINSVPVRVKGVVDMTISEALKSVTQQSVESNQHDWCSLSEIQQQSSLGSQLFQSVFAFENYQVSDEAQDASDTKPQDISIEAVPVKEESFNEISISAFEANDELCLELTYDKSKYTQHEMDSLLSAWKNIVSLIAEDSSSKTKDLHLLTAEEEETLVAIGTGDALQYDKSKMFLDLFSEQVEQRPDAVAVCDATSRITYKELDEASSEYAEHVTTNTFVCVEMPRVKEFVVAVLGIWKAGSAYVPIDTEYPEERKSFIREECDGQPLPTQTSGPTDQIAYMIYTSGTTGKPKGVMIQHNALTNFIQFVAKEWHLTSQSRISCHSSFAFDASVEDLYPVLTVGGTLYVMPEEIRKDISLISDYIVENGITGGNYTTQLGQMLMQFKSDLPLDYIVLGGEKMTMSSNCSCRVINTYGPTECTVDATFFELAKGITYQNIPIGKPLANSVCFILDTFSHLVPAGVIGELCISGPQLAAGYYNNPELTSQKFTQIQVDGITYSVYHTGDLCRWHSSSARSAFSAENDDGQLEYVGRIDNQVKLRGFRIELGEIESVAVSQEGVQQAVALVKGNQIVLYYTGDEMGDAMSIMQNSQLPDYMIPTVYVHLDDMPMTTNGKIDHKALPEPELKDEEIVLPATMPEEQVLAIVKDALGISAVGVTSNLISLGMSSITAMRLAMRISAELHQHITMSQLMAKPTVRNIATCMTTDEDSMVGRVREKQKYYPLTDNQLGVYLDWEQHRDGLQYNIPFAIKLQGYAPDRLKTAIETTIEAHPYLKAKLAVVNGDVMLERCDDALSSVRCSALTDNEHINDFFQSCVRPFNLFEDSLYRFEIYVVSHQTTERPNDQTTDTYLFYDIHHIITDGISDGMLVNDILAAYNGDEILKESYSAFDRALEEAEIKKDSTGSPTAEYCKAGEYFRNLLVGKESTLYPHSIDASGDGHCKSISVNVPNSDIVDLCAKNGITPGNYLLFVFMDVIRRMSRENDVLIMTVNNGREHAAMQDIQGFFVKTLPVISNAASTASDIQQQLIETISHECYPLTEMVQQMGIRPEIMYSYAGGLMDNIGETEGMEIIPLSLDTAKVPLNLTINPSENEFVSTIEYDDSLYSDRDMQTLLKCFATLAENYASANEAEVDVPLSKCAMLTKDEEQALITLGSAEILEYDKTKTFIDLFREQAEKTPDAIAVADATSQLTYRELDEASDEYAETVTSGTFVCLEMPRVKEFVVAVIGIWKASSAYVPIDPDYPKERKLYMREETDGQPLPVDNQPNGQTTKRPNDQIAYMIYTSGSTGKPKGVMVQHSAYLNCLHAYIKQQELTSADRMACHRNFCFDASLEDLFPILAVGGQLHIMPSEIRKDLDAIHHFIVSRQITCTSFTTTLAELLLQTYPDIPLRYIVAGGEKLHPIEGLQTLLCNFYGPTECTVFSVTAKIEPGVEYKEVPIGRPVSNLRVFILDRNGQFLPQGAAGELCISGPQLSLGYYKNPEMTQDRFTQVTINDEEVKIYKTGDLCRWRPDGQIEYISRIDNQVKLRGYRIELGEIEAVALNLSGVHQAVAVIKNNQIVLYYTGDQNEDLKLEFENSTLPEYMVPNVYMHLDSMPMTPNGKVDRKTLPEPEYKEEDIVLPVTVQEEQILEIVKKALGLTTIGVTSNLISLGMSSITAMRLAMRITSELHQHITMSQLMATPTVRGIVSCMTADEDSVVGRVRDKQEYYPLTDNQLGVYLDWEQHRDGLQYNVPFAIKLNGYDPNKLKTAIETTIEAHPYLKSRLVAVNGEVMLQRRDEDELTVDVVQCEIGNTQEFFQSHVRPFNLFDDSLCRFEIYTSEEYTYLFYDIHHIITDGISDGILVNDILAAYNGKEIHEETYSAFDRALEESEIKHSDEYEKSGVYFKNLLHGKESMVYPHSIDAIGKGNSKYINNTIKNTQIVSHCAKIGATPSNYFMTVFMEVIRRITREKDVLIMTISNGREHTAMQDIQGFFVKTLPVVSTSKSTVADMQHQLIESISKECYPLTEMVQQMGIRPEIMYSYEGGLMDNIVETDGMELISLDLDTAKVPLSVTVSPFSDEYTLSVEYDDSLYSEKDMQTLLNCFATLAENYASTNARTLSECSMLTEKEEQNLISLGTGETLQYDKTKTFLDLFKAQVEATPDAIAVCDANSRITYKELDEASTEYAKQVTSGTFVCLEMPRTKDFLIAVLGIWKAGSAYVPIDTEYPEERKQFIREECDGKQLTVNNEQLTVNNDQIAYMIYTSGTTGKPKGVMIQHSALTHFIQFIAKEWNLTLQSRISCHSSFAFDASVEDLYPVLTVGGTLYIMPEEIRKDISLISDYIVENGITGGNYTTQLGQMLLQHKPDIPLDYIVLGGEKMTLNSNCQCRLINTYGPTECTVDATYYELEKGKVYQNIPIGRPLSNSICFILDTDSHLLPEGLTGELCISGPQLAAGYYNNPELTQEKFAQVQFAGLTFNVYHTGDLCRWSTEGQLEYIGRIDNQVKLRGFRIELGEIESVSLKQEGIDQAVAVIKNNQIVLYYTGEQRENLKLKIENSSLPAYMVPNIFMHLDVMPFTTNGKVDRKSLPEPELTLEDIIAPETENEKTVFDIIASYMKVEGFGVTTNLVSLGMSSLSAMRVVATINSRMSVNLRVAEVMKNPTVRDIVAIIEGCNITPSEDIRPYEYREFYPITENQRGIYVDWEMNRDTTQYNIPSLYPIAQDIDVDKLAECIRLIVNVHSYLKTRFAIHDNDVMQQRRDDEDAVVTVTTLAEEPDQNYFQDKVRPFDIFNGPLYRIEIVTTPYRKYLFTDVHHLIYDGLSSNVFFQDLFTLMSGDSIQPEHITSYDYTLYEQQHANGEAFTKAEEYFDVLLSQMGRQSYPHSAKLDDDTSGSLTVSVPAKAIDTYCGRIGVTVNSFLHAAFVETLRCLTRDEHPTYITVSNGRGASTELLRCIGMFVKTLPVVGGIGMTESTTVQELVTTMHSQLQDSINQDFYSYTRMVERHGIHAEMLFYYQGGLMEGTAEAHGLEMLDANVTGQMDAQVMTLSLDTCKFPIEIMAAPNGDYYVLTISYDGSLYCYRDMEQLASCLKNVCIGMTLCEKVSEISLVDEAEQNELIALGRGETLDYDHSETLVDLFRKQAAVTADAIAIVYKDKKLTYKEVDEITDRLANHLINTYRVEKEEAVGVMIDRSELMLIYPMAVMKAGATYMPLDYKFPADRLQYMCEDAGVRLVLSEGALVKDAMPEFDGDVFTSEELKSLPKVTAHPSFGVVDESLRFVLLYTSGSTGKPKGVALEHHNIVNFCHWYVKEFDVTSADRAVAYANFGFDAHMMDMYPALSVGATVYIIPSDMRMNLMAMNDYMEKNHLTIAFITTQIGYIFATSIENHSLRLLSVGGEKLMPLKKPPFRFYNGYGPTECTLYSTCYNIDKDYDSSLIGRPLANYQLFVMDNNLHLVPKGVAGELVVAGEGVGRGYLHPSEKDAMKFTEITINNEKIKVYRTGDLCQWNADGQIMFIGRIDNQVKLRGLRIELGEIESKVLAFKGIKLACVDVKEVNGVQNLCCYYTVEKGMTIDQEALKVSLMEDLTDYMVPEIYIALDEMPFTANGKIDRKALPEPQYESERYAAPETITEKMLCKVIAEQLHIQRIGITDNLKASGMSSIIAMRVGMKLMQLGYPVNMGMLLKYSNIQMLAQQIENGMEKCEPGSWIRPFDETKKVIVICCGVASANKYISNVDSWFDKYNIYMLQPLFNSWTDIDTLTYTELLDRYIELLKRDVPCDISCFFGFSFGGELAYRLACRWNGSAQVLMGDTFMRVDDIDVSDADSDANITEEEYNWHLQVKIIAQLGVLPTERYSGKVTLISANNGDDSRDKNEQFWRTLKPDVNIVRIEDTHAGIGMNAKYYPMYYDIIQSQK